jgi:hypothetical protein
MPRRYAGQGRLGRSREQVRLHFAYQSGAGGRLEPPDQAWASRADAGSTERRNAKSLPRPALVDVSRTRGHSNRQWLSGQELRRRVTAHAGRGLHRRDHCCPARGIFRIAAAALPARVTAVGRLDHLAHRWLSVDCSSESMRLELDHRTQDWDWRRGLDGTFAAIRFSPRSRWCRRGGCDRSRRDDCLLRSVLRRG